ncbi:MAG: ATP-binding protein [Synergistaceae bacterium]|nr:ATP-binding protein [Synergistaceae bacterium]
MADNNSIFEQLKADNPFLSVASPLPWENKTPDVSQLNVAVSTQIEQLIRDKRRQPPLPLSGLIFGGVGMGKTHMLTRILRRLRKNAWHAIFVNIRAFTNPKRVTQELLSEIFICLTEPHSNGRSQFDMLMSEMMDMYRERRREDGFTDADMPPPKDYLKRDMPKLSRAFLKCIMQYIGTSDFVVRDKIIEWLREGLDDEDSLSLGLPMRDVSSMDDAECESSAKGILDSLGVVLSYARVPMIICFDELDTMEGKKELIGAWGDTVGFLMNNISGILPLCFVKEGVWDGEFIPVLNQALIQRLRSSKMMMKGCSVQQAKQLVHDRIASNFSEGAEEKYDCLMSLLGDSLKPGMSPREVIQLAGAALTGPQIDPIKEAYSDEFKKVQTEPRAWPPNSDRMILAASEWLSAHSSCEVQGTWGKHIKIAGTVGDRHIAFALPVPKTAQTAMAVVNECIKFLKEYPGSFCCYVKEKKAHKPTWRAFAKKLEDFCADGGHMLELDDESRIEWYALASMINQISNGNVNIYQTSGSRAATLSDAREFIRSINLVPGLFSPNNAETPSNAAPSAPAAPDDILKEAVLRVIKSSPMKIISAEKAVTLLAGKQIHVTRNELLVCVNAHKDSFRTYTSKGRETMIGLAGK